MVATGYFIAPHPFTPDRNIMIQRCYVSPAMCSALQFIIMNCAHAMNNMKNFSSHGKNKVL